MRPSLLPILCLAALLAPVASPCLAEQKIEDIQILPFHGRTDRAALEARIAAPAASAREIALAWHGLAGLKVEDASFKAVDLISDLPELETEPLLQAYLGSAFVMRARDQSFIGSRIGSVRQGLKWLDRATRTDQAAARTTFEIHALRAASTMNLPDIFDYRKNVRADLQLMLRAVEKGDAPIAQGSAGEGRIIASLAKICELQGDRPCAETQISALDARFAGNSELSQTARQLRAALGN